MQNNTDPGKRLAPVVCALVMIVLLAVLLAALILPVLGGHYESTAETVIIVLYSLITLAVIAGIVLALVQRLREIKSGEEEDAKKY